MVIPSRVNLLIAFAIVQTPLGNNKGPCFSFRDWVGEKDYRGVIGEHDVPMLNYCIRENVTPIPRGVALI